MATPIKITLLIALFLSISFQENKNNITETIPSKLNVVTTATLDGVQVSTFMYQIQGEYIVDGEIDSSPYIRNSDIDALSTTDYDMIVIEPGHNLANGIITSDTAYMVNNLKTKSNGDRRLLIAYIDVGQAEEWRSYWQGWTAPTENGPGVPSFMRTIDPDGWVGNYPVAYWDQRWQDIWLSDNGIIKNLANLGFDGVYLDWVEAYDDQKIQDFATLECVNPEDEMMKFIDRIKNTGKTINPNFLVIAQNAQYLLNSNPTYYASVIDAIATEDTWFYGEGDAEWDSSTGGDLTGGSRHDDGNGDYATANRIAQNLEYVNLGVPVFTVDYCLSSTNANSVYSESRANGFIPLVTRVSLAKITETPPF